MHTALLVVTLLAAPPTVTAPRPLWAAPPAASPRVQPTPRQAGVPPLPWERIIRRCGAPCLVWARHVLDAATSPGGFAWQIKALADAARRAHRAGKLRPRDARRLRLAIGHLAAALRRTTADGLLTHRERLRLLRGIIRTGAALHRATRVGAHPGAWYRGRGRPRRLPAPPPAPPAPPAPATTPAVPPAAH